MHAGPDQRGVTCTRSAGSPRLPAYAVRRATTEECRHGRGPALSTPARNTALPIALLRTERGSGRGRTTGAASALLSPARPSDDPGHTSGPICATKPDHKQSDHKADDHNDRKRAYRKSHPPTHAEQCANPRGAIRLASEMDDERKSQPRGTAVVAPTV